STASLQRAPVSTTARRKRGLSYGCECNDRAYATQPGLSWTRSQCSYRGRNLMPPCEREMIGVIEDDPLQAGTLTHRLELEGYRPLWWRTGQDAVAGLLTVQPDLVVCDIRLPDMSGEDVFLQALPRLGGRPFLFITAYADVEQAVRLTKAGAADYIAKPY